MPGSGSLNSMLLSSRKRLAAAAPNAHQQLPKRRASLEAKMIYYQVPMIYSRVISYQWSESLELEGPTVLTQAESDTCVGALSWNELHAWILHLHSLLPSVLNLNCLPEDNSDRVGYSGWLSYCIAYNHCFGVVHAGVSTLLLSVSYSLPLPLPVNELDKPNYNSALCYDTCICIDGVHTVNWEAPVLEIQGYKMLNMRKRNRWTRRVWDICANRVIPWADSLPDQAIVPISHAWVASEDMEYHATNVNHYLWPVPLPRGVQLEGIRKELIQHNIRYAWLDVLCLRQDAQPQLCPSKTKTLSAEMRRFSTGCLHSGSYSDLVKRREERRTKEWEVDIPFIGNLYMLSSLVFVYLSGLGRPFNPYQDWSDPLNWLRRAWTLQETKPRQNTLIGGLSKGMNPWTCKIDKAGTTLETALESIQAYHGQLDFTRLFKEMQSRAASKPLDKIWGLFFPCLNSVGRGTLTASDSLTLPLYNANDEPEHAWQLFIHALAKVEGPRPGPTRKTRTSPRGDTLALHLLLHFPYPSAQHWFPSLRQVHAYPKVSLQEPQLDDHKTPGLNAPLTIKWGRLYRRVQLVDVGGRKPGLLVAIGQGDEGGIRLDIVNYKSGMDLGIISGETYTLLDLTPFYTNLVDAVHDGHRTTSLSMQGAQTSNSLDVFRPLWKRNLIIVCTELSKWNPPSPGHSTRAPYQYRLRRVTSCTWRRRPSEHWLPFKETIRTMLSKEIEPTTARPNFPCEWRIPNPRKGEPLHVQALLQ